MENYKNNEIFYPVEVREVVPFASGSGYVLSSDLVNFLNKNLQMLQRYYNEVICCHSKCNGQDVSIGTWLFPLEINRFHEPRFNIGWKCDNDAIIVHAVKERQIMEKLYVNSNDPKTCICEQIKRGDVK
jgi:galactosylxylosylprotein 3-beta-galactosyltransferase